MSRTSRSPLLALGAVALALSLPPAAQARPAYRKALVDLLELPQASRLNDCRTCHLPDKPGAAADDKPHNAFGKRLKAVRAELRKAGKPADITARLLAIADEDSDGDGVPNLVELLTGHAPGDPRDKPGPAEAAAGRKRQAALLESLRGYRWRPFERVQRPPLPAVKDCSQARNPIDLFVAAEHERRGLTPRPEAPRHVLLRRVYLDLTGLPPTRAELHAFLADDRPDAYERVVDRLLASPRYGERWGRHWMDVWRYADWAGYGAQVRDSQPHIWHWRDWIVESLNADKGYDRMVQEMLAADELAPTDAKALRATGYLVRNFKLLSREKWLQDTVDHTAQGFLGITLGCARCHDHLFDPLLQREYYQFRAIFTPHGVRTDRLPGFPDVAKNGLPRAYDADLTAPTFLFLRGDDRTPDKKPLPPGVPEALGGSFTVAPVSLPRDAYQPERRPFVLRDAVTASADGVARARAAVVAARQGLARAAALGLDASPLRAMTRLAGAERAREALALAELDAALAEARHTALLAVLRAEEVERSTGWKEAATAAARAQRLAALAEARRALFAARQAARQAPPKGRPAAAKKAAEAEKALARAEANAQLPDTTAYTRRALPSYPPTSTGRRLALARWVTHRDNPLAARVAVNHLWLRHFGQALVPSVFDFGRNGRAPTHPALLDWLAVELMERDWGMKALHRLIVTSAAYRRASTPDAANLARDPDNRFLWRMVPRRVEAEVVRDSVFHVAGRLDQALGGPDLDHNLGLSLPRRSLYFRHAAEKRMGLLLLFDAASVTECYQRTESILPQQALALANSELTQRHARILARALTAEAGGGAGRFSVAAFEAVLSRAPTAEEKAECVAFLEAAARRFAARKLPAAAPDRDGAAPASDPALRARENLVQVLLNHHEFVTVR
jgi:hypothetical protein